MKPTLRTLALAIGLFSVSLTSAARQPLHLVSDAQLAQMGQQQFEEMKAKQRMSNDPRQQAAVQCVVDSLRRVLPAPYSTQAWEVRVFVDDTPNAFALPGAKVGVNTGMFKVAQSQDELAAVLGHEMGHVVARHSNERVSRQMLTQGGLQLLGAIAGQHASAQTTRGLMTAAGGGAQLFLLLPNSRQQEAEADQLGQRYMAQAGFDPARAVTLWQHMEQGAGGSAPQFLSTHPNPQNRIRDLAARAPSLQSVARAAHAAGRSPKCF
ncbi:M48 family metallopeptidase [Cognatilysobacter lacus]|uniref:M48 family metallopeptidase n=1 Tax=Cognatilysobacter lacus TaxID=1643323 RepID=A0A5D8Z8K6_9GAMM|nr:M48 family metallopeptidase [Lysobacter lacus]TZF90980.1 M48 family metallopeptidase [Lysobacter lacus]